MIARLRYISRTSLVRQFFERRCPHSMRYGTSVPRAATSQSEWRVATRIPRVVHDGRFRPIWTDQGYLGQNPSLSCACKHAWIP